MKKVVISNRYNYLVVIIDGTLMESVIVDGSYMEEINQPFFSWKQQLPLGHRQFTDLIHFY